MTSVVTIDLSLGSRVGHSVTGRTDWQVICVFFIDLLRGFLAPETAECSRRQVGARQEKRFPVCFVPRKNSVTVWTSDVMAAVALSESTTYPSSITHKTSATALTHPSGQPQDRPRLLSVLQQNLGWDLCEVYCSALAEKSGRVKGWVWWSLRSIPAIPTSNNSVISLAWAGVVVVLLRMSLLQLPLPFCKSCWFCSAAENCTWEPN